jgi:glycine cleavage system H protein
MDGFTYHDIFQTKGIEYLIIIAFLMLIIPFWIVLNKRREIGVQIFRAAAFTLDLLKVPLGVRFSRNHTWTYMDKSGAVEVGLDEFLVQLTGSVRFSALKGEGEEITKGGLLAEIGHEGKMLKVPSPVSGRIIAVNPLLEDPAAIQQDACGKGWIYRIEPMNWAAETGQDYIGEQAVGWFGSELKRLKDFIAVTAARHRGDGMPVVLQEGGELQNHPLSGLPPEVWQDFQKEFLENED